MARHITVGGLGATVVGTAAHVANEFERWVAEADVDGFNIVSRAIIPQILCKDKEVQTTFAILILIIWAGVRT